jgi:hypothetical protein
MPHQLTITESRLENTIACLTSAVKLLNELNDAFCPPFFQPLLSILQALIHAAQV